MKILSTDIWHIFYEKRFDAISILHVSGDPKNISIGIQKYDLKSITNIKISFNAKYLEKTKKEEIGRFHCAVVVKISLDADEIRRGEELKPTLEHAAITQAWPLLDQALLQLPLIKIDYEKLPPPPSKEAVLDKKGE